MKLQVKIILFFLFILVSCASLDTNQVRKSVLYIKGGQSANLVWTDSLKLKRTSWYHKANLLYEVNVLEIPLDSPFMSWFDSNEKNSLKRCQQLLWVVDYTYDSRRIQPNYVRNLLSESGYVDISVVNFSKNFLNHPDTGTLSNSNYRMRLFCHETNKFSGISATIPGFGQENIEF